MVLLYFQTIAKYIFPFTKVSKRL